MLVDCLVSTRKKWTGTEDRSYGQQINEDEMGGNELYVDKVKFIEFFLLTRRKYIRCKALV